jgi:hypothetical protein
MRLFRWRSGLSTTPEQMGLDLRVTRFVQLTQQLQGSCATDPNHLRVADDWGETSGEVWQEEQWSSTIVRVQFCAGAVESEDWNAMS